MDQQLELGSGASALKRQALQLKPFWYVWLCHGLPKSAGYSSLPCIFSGAVGFHGDFMVISWDLLGFIRIYHGIPFGKGLHSY